MQVVEFLPLVQTRHDCINFAIQPYPLVHVGLLVFHVLPFLLSYPPFYSKDLEGIVNSHLIIGFVKFISISNRALCFEI